MHYYTLTTPIVMVCTCKCIHHIDLQGPSFSVEYDNYPVTESAGEVEVCVAYYGTQSLASSATVQLRTLDNPMFPGQSPGKYSMYPHCKNRIVVLTKTFVMCVAHLYPSPYFPPMHLLHNYNLSLSCGHSTSQNSYHDKHL